MKILQIINNLGSGGAEKLLEELIPLLNNYNDTEVDLLLLTDKNNVFDKKLKDKNINIIFLKHNNIYNPLNIKGIADFINSNNYDAVHSHLFHSKYWLALAQPLIKDKNIKYITTEHNTSNRRRNKFFLKPIEKYIYSKYDLIISISKKAETNLIEWLSFKNNEKFMVIENGIDTSKFINSIPYEKDEIVTDFDFKTKIITMVGRFTEQKDQKTLIKALGNNPEDVHLLLIGEGPLEEEMINLSKKLKINNRVHFLGFRNDIAKVLKTSDIVVLSSHYEGLSLSSIEGMASGSPFVASDVEGLTDIVKGYGLLFEEGNSKELSELIMKLLNDKDFYNKISENCVRRAKQYDINKMADALRNEYKKLIY